MNEGWASFWHYTLMHELYNRGLVNEGFILEFLQSHSNVVFQPDFDDRRYSGINPYALGFNIFTDIKRICEHPTEEDKAWFPDIAGKDWLDTMHFAMKNFKDESFILQFLSPKVIRDMKFFSIIDDERKSYLSIDAIHDEQGYKHIRESLAAQYNLGNREPNIQIYNVDVKGDRSLTLRHFMHNDRPLGDSTQSVIKHIRRIWGFDVKLECVSNGKVKKTYHCPEKNVKAKSTSLISLH